MTVAILKGMITEDALRSLVKFNREALGLASVYKEELVTGTAPTVKAGPWYKIW